MNKAAEDTARDLSPGSFYVIEHAAVVEYLWSGDDARRAHAQLARALTSMGVPCEDMPGMGVIVRKEHLDPHVCEVCGEQLTRREH